MDDSSKQQLKCPVGESECMWLEEIEKLRSQVGELTKLVSTDALTGLYNYRHFKELLQTEMDRSKRSGIPTTLVKIDLDHFKKLNEVRTTDCVCRNDGDEFAIIFPETHLNLAVKVADRIREIIASSPVVHDKGEYNITASMGASVYLKTSIIDYDTFIDSVDGFLDEARQSGGNCICHIDYADLHKVTEIGYDKRLMLSGED
jgi:PleD family two-component response regulator